MGITWGMPQWFWALAALPVMTALLLWGERYRLRVLERVVAARLQPMLAGSVSVAKRRVQFALLLAGLVCVITALAQPRRGYTFDKAKRKGRDVLIAIDTSRSMLSTDAAPNRLTRAKLAAQDLANALEGDRVGLIAFAGTAFLQAPLTVDYSAFLFSLDELDTNIIPVGGTCISDAIRCARDAFGKGESESRALVLMTDGEELDGNALAAAREAAGTMRIFTVGIGTPEGSLIPVPGENGGTDFVKDPQGNFVKSRLDEKRLQEIASVTSGFYTRLGNGPADMRRIVTEGLGKLKETDFNERMSRHPIERYQWPLAAGLVLLAASMLVTERRKTPGRTGANGKPFAGVRAAVLLLAGAVLLLPGKAGAATGEELYKQGKFDEARKQFEAEAKRRPNAANTFSGQLRPLDELIVTTSSSRTSWAGA